jgi:cell division protein FtsB
MTNRRKNQSHAVPLKGRKLGPALRVVPRGVVSAAEQSVSSVRSDLLRSVDFHPALALLAGVAIIALVCVIYLSQVTAVTNANYTLQALQDEHTLMLREKQDLLLEIARAQSLSTIDREARNRLRMVPIGEEYEYLPIAPGPIQGYQPETPAQEPGSDLQPHQPGESTP